MGIVKKTEIDKIEIVGEFKCIQIRQAIIVEEDGVELSKTFNRYTLMPDTDMADQPTDVVSISNIYWTDELKQKYAESIEIE